MPNVDDKAKAQHKDFSVISLLFLIMVRFGAKLVKKMGKRKDFCEKKCNFATDKTF